MNNELCESQPGGCAWRERFNISFAKGVPYAQALDWQLAAVERLKRDRSGPAALFCVEHQPVVTMGRAGEEVNLLAGRAALEKAGIAYFEASRGGDITYHGPGQATLYPVFPMEWIGRDLHRYLRLLEETGIAFLARHGVEAHREHAEKPRTGVWVGERKIQAEGIAVTNWIAYHGLAVNIQPDMEAFALIRPCGIGDKGVTSLAELTGKRYDMDEQMGLLVEAFFEVLAGLDAIRKG